VTVPQLGTKFTSHLRTTDLITMFTGSNHLSLSWAIWIQSTPILILYSHLCLDLAGGLFPSGFSTKRLHAFLFSVRATCSVHLIQLDFAHAVIWRWVQDTKGSEAARSCSLLLLHRRPAYTHAVMWHPDSTVACLSRWWCTRVVVITTIRGHSRKIF
jgi:hypothetical protein